MKNFNVEAMIEIPKGSNNKYEYDHERNVIKLDRFLYSPMFYPTDYGFIDNTLSTDGDPLDILVVVNNPTFPGCLIDARVIGMFLMEDEAGKDEKLIAVPVKDPRFDEVQTLDDLPKHLLKEIEHFFKEYKTLEKKSVKIGGFFGLDKALEILEEAKERFKKEHK